MEINSRTTTTVIDSASNTSTKTNLFNAENGSSYVINNIPYFSSEQPTENTQYVNIIRDNSVINSTNTNGQPSYFLTTNIDGNGTNTILLDTSQLALLTQQTIPTALYDGTSIFQLATQQTLTEPNTITIATSQQPLLETVSIESNPESQDHEYSSRAKSPNNTEHVSKKLKEVNQNLDHILPPHKKGPFKCIHCDKEFIKHKQLKRHIKKHDDEKAYKCDVCSASFNFSLNLTLHKATHCTSDPVCPICNKSFGRIASLKAHIMNHEIDETLLCEKCGEEFATQIVLDRHMKVHSEDYKDEEEEEEENEDEFYAPKYICKKCPKTFSKFIFLKQHMRKHRRLNLALFSKPYRKNIDRSSFHHRCLTCGKKFQKPSQLIRHIRIHTGEKPFKCDVCERAFNQKGALQIHMTKHNGHKPYNCEFCPATFSQRGNLRAHIHRVHTLHVTEVFKCEDCACVFKSLGSRNSHLRRAHGREISPNKILEQTENAKDSQKEDLIVQEQMDNVLNHLLDMAKQAEGNSDQVLEQIQPKNAKSNAGNTDILQQALENSGLTNKEISRKTEQKKETLSQTLIVSVTDTATGKINRHFVRKVGKETWRQCIYCSKEFKKVNDLVRHVRIHTHDKPYKCNQCFRAFSVKSTLKAHEYTHLGVKDFKCNVCEKMLSSQGSLRVHKLLHTGIKPYSCHICGKSYRTSGHRNGHLHSHQKESVGLKYKRSPKFKKDNVQVKEIPLPDPILITDEGLVTKHIPKDLSVKGVTSERPYCCYVCQRAFKKSSHMKQHVRSHTGEKPFQCSQCHRCFVSNGVLKTHLKTHSGIKPFKCNLCSASFTTNGSLKRHSLIHTDERPYMCPYCQKTYKTSLHCRKHMKSHRHELEQNGNAVVSVTILSDGQNGLPNEQIVENTETQILLTDVDSSVAAETEIHTDDLADHEQESVLVDNIQPLQTLDIQNLENQSTDLNVASVNFLNHTLSQFAANNFSENQFSLQPDSLINLNGPFISTSLNTENSVVSTICPNSENMLQEEKKKKPTESKSRIKIHECSVCGKTFKKSSHFKEHARTHTGERPHQCLKCRKMFVSISVLKSHIKTHEGARDYGCTICNATFTTKGSLQRHVANHSKEKPLKCNNCNFTCSTKFILKHHAKEHIVIPDSEKKGIIVRKTGSTIQISEEETHALAKQNPETADSISEQMLIASVAEKNRISLIKTKTFDPSEPKHRNQCCHCVKSFKKPSDLVRHLRIHTGEKPFGCEICGKQFTVKSTLDSHLKTHTGAKNFKCHICDSMFSTKGSLKVHMRLHTGARPFKCLHCDQQFRTSGHRQSHMVTHLKNEIKIPRTLKLLSQDIPLKTGRKNDHNNEIHPVEHSVLIENPIENITLGEQMEVETINEGIQFHLTPGLVGQNIQLTPVDPNMISSKPIQIDSSLLQQLQQHVNINITFSPNIVIEPSGDASDSASTPSTQHIQAKVSQDNINNTANTITFNPNIFVQQLGYALNPKLELTKDVAPDIDDTNPLDVIPITINNIPQNSVIKNTVPLVTQNIQESHENVEENTFTDDLVNAMEFVEVTIADQEVSKNKTLSSNLFQCSLCPMSFNKKKALVNHLRTHECDISDNQLPKKHHRCVYCEMVFSQKKSLHAHIKRSHPIS